MVKAPSSTSTGSLGNHASGAPRGGKGEPFVHFTGAALLVTVAMVLGVILLLAMNGLGFFWPDEILRVRADDGAVLIGEPWRHETFVDPSGVETRERTRTLYRVGNRQELGTDFIWLEDERVAEVEQPADAVLFERLEWGPAIGILRETRRAGETLGTGGDEGFAVLQRSIDEARAERRGRLAPAVEDAVWTSVIEIADGRSVEIPLAAVVRAVRPNAMGLGRRLQVYSARLWEFVAAEPRESNTEGGIFPAILGTVLMVLLMTLAVVPLGVVGALYLNEYARQGRLVQLVRLAVSNLAGVPSIVFGMFGLAFFIYTVGSSLDELFYADHLPAPTFGTGGLLWASLTLALLTVPVVVVSTEEALRAVPRAQREGSLALGATRWQTIRTVILPASLPGILTGMILAISRGAGEVAPLMLTGVVKLAPDPLVNSAFPYLHADRKFMHLGFHVYDVGFQSPNVEAAKPMVYSTAFLLLLLIVILNLTAILYRNRVKRRLVGSTF